MTAVVVGEVVAVMIAAAEEMEVATTAVGEPVR
jgi:hypothetical protein